MPYLAQPDTLLTHGDHEHCAPDIPSAQQVMQPKPSSTVLRDVVCVAPTDSEPHVAALQCALHSISVPVLHATVYHFLTVYQQSSMARGNCLILATSNTCMLE